MKRYGQAARIRRWFRAQASRKSQLLPSLGDSSKTNTKAARRRIERIVSTGYRTPEASGTSSESESVLLLKWATTLS